MSSRRQWNYIYSCAVELYYTDKVCEKFSSATRYKCLPSAVALPGKYISATADTTLLPVTGSRIDANCANRNILSGPDKTDLSSHHDRAHNKVTCMSV